MLVFVFNCNRRFINLPYDDDDDDDAKKATKTVLLLLFSVFV